MLSTRLAERMWSALISTGSNRTIAPRRPRGCRLQLEPLEDRLCPSYTVTDLGSLGGSYYSLAHALNEAGQVVGTADTAYYEAHAFLRENGVMNDLGTLGWWFSVANDINDGGQVVGTSGFGGVSGGDDPPPDRPFLWQNGVMTDLMPDIEGAGHAYAINNAGVIVGDASTASGTVSAFVWEAGLMYDLNSLSPAGPSLHLNGAYDINDNRQIVGWGSTANGESHPFLYTDDDGIFANGGGVLTDLGALFGRSGAAHGLNNAGQVVGSAGDHAFLYSDGVMTDLNTLAGYRSGANAINDAGQIVGWASPTSTNTSRAFLWQNGQMVDLNNLIYPSAGWTLSSAEDINERGEIAGYSKIGDMYRALLLTESSTSTLMISDATVTEGDTGTTSAVFTVTLWTGSAETVTVNYATANGSANAGSDYQSASGTLTFSPGETSKTIAITVSDDTLDESDETFVVNLSSPTNAVLTRSAGLGTILDDDPPPALTIDDVTLAEGSSGPTSPFTFTVSLSATSGKTVQVYFASADGTASTTGSILDYNSAYGLLTFAPAETIKTITVGVYGDSLAEPNETFFVNLSLPNNSINATIVDGQGVGTILDDDSPPTLVISDVTRTEGKSGITYFVFTVTLSAVSSTTVSINFATANGTAKSGEDYTAASGTLTFAPGETTKTIIVQVKGDKKKEGNETFLVKLSGASNAFLADSQGLGTILNDD